MKKLNFKISRSLLLFLLMISLSANAWSRTKDEVRVALAYDPTTINILELKTGIDLPPIMHIHESLLSVDAKTGEYTTDLTLSESMELLPNGRDIRFKLRKNAIFHTGDPLTAHDVKFTYDQCVNPRNANLLSSALEEIEEIEIVDDHTVIFHLYEPYAAWKELFWVGIASKKYFEKVGKEKFRSHPVGSGVFKFVERKIGEFIRLERFDKHPVFRPQYKKLTFVTVPDELTRVSMLDIGDLDLISDINPVHLRTLKKNEGIIIKRESEVPSLFGLAMRVDNYPIWKDMYLARAFQHAINRKEIVDRVFLKEGYPLHMSASKIEIGYDPSFQHDFDPEKAKRLVAKSSYKEGTPITLTYTNATPNANIVAAIIQRYLKNIGVTIRLQKLESSVQATYSRNKDPREGHMVLYSLAGGRDPNMRIQLTMHSKSMYAAWTARPCQKELDRLIGAQSKEVNESKRLTILKRIHKYIIDEPSGVPLFGLNMIYAHSDRITYDWVPGQPLVFHLQNIKVLK
jgi:peptide/nickel transport system substrate-binding protein